MEKSLQALQTETIFNLNYHLPYFPQKLYTPTWSFGLKYVNVKASSYVFKGFVKKSYVLASEMLSFSVSSSITRVAMELSCALALTKKEPL